MAVLPVAAVAPRAQDLHHRVHCSIMPRMRDIEIRGDMIRLGQLLKLAGLAGSGTDAKALIASGAVTVNGEPETRRGRQLHVGDEVALGGETVRLV